MQRMFNIDKWTRLEEGKSLEFVNPRPRNVRLEVNAPVKSALYIADPEGEVRFLALVEGRDTIEFGSTGAFELTVEGEAINIYTADGDDISQKVIAPVIFTKIVERRRRNPELEQIAALMTRNMERRLEQQAADLEALYIRRNASQSQAASVSGGARGEPKQADGAEPSGAPTASTPAGDRGEDSGGPGAGGNSGDVPSRPASDGQSPVPGKRKA